MPNQINKKICENLLIGTGVKINGNNAWDLQVKNPDFYNKVLSEGSLGLGESYMNGDWECEKIDEFIFRILKTKIERKVISPKLIFSLIKTKTQNLISNPQSINKSKRVAKEHYDIGNELYESMLDKKMQYTCGYWKDAKNLDQAQENKLELITKKLKISSGMKILELGGGFGALAKHLAKNHGCKIVSYNISKEQVKYARKFFNHPNIRFEEKDYREAIKEKEKFNRVVSIGLMEHVGPKNYKKFMKIAKESLTSNGDELFLLHTIGSNKTKLRGERWIGKYIFPGGHIPSQAQLTKATNGLFVIEDWHNFGADYDKTLMEWHNNFQKAWPQIKKKQDKEYNDQFKRMWDYYLLSCAGTFRARRTQLWQVVLSPNGIKEGYESVR